MFTISGFLRDLTQRRQDAKGEEMKKVSHTPHRDGSGKYTAQI
jgi:hypothetical protein